MKRFYTLAILLASSGLFGQTYTTPIQVNMGGSGLADRSPMMRLDRSGNIFIAWVRGADGSQNGPIAMSVSTDGGSTFSMPNVVCSDANCNSNFQRTAQFVLDTKGNIHLVWMGNRVNKQPDIWYTRSIDKGKTWSTPVSVCDADDSSKYAQDFPSIACDSSDNLYVSFLDSREVQRDSKNGHVQLYFTRSLDGGMTWSKNMKADILPGGMGGTCECCTERIAASSDGHLYIAFRSNISNLRDIWLARSNDKGLTFQPALKLSSGDWHVDACPVSGPNLALDPDEGAHIVWRDVRDDSMGISHVYYAYVPKGSTETPVNTAFDAPGASLANYADIALYGTNRVITYQTANYGTRYLLYSGSKTVINNRPIPSGTMQEFPTVLFAADGTRYLSWQDAKNDNGDIYFCKETSPLTTASVETENPEPRFTIYPNPVSKQNSTITLEWISSTPATIKIVDMLGREVMESQKMLQGRSQLTLPKLATGIYYCIATDWKVILKQSITVE